MVQQCWHYKFNGNTSTSTVPTCTGSFEQCALLVDCKPDRKNPACFALAKLEASNNSSAVVNENSTTAAATTTSTTTTTTSFSNKTTILSSGCFDENEEQCDKTCLGEPKRGGNFYCCCTTDGCNNNLTPKNKPPLPPTTKPPPPTPPGDGPYPSYTLPVMLIVLLGILTIVATAKYFKRTRLKRNSEQSTRGSGSNGLTSNHQHELQAIGTIPDAMMPLGNSYGGAENGRRFHYGQHEMHQSDTKFTNYARGMNHNGTSNAINSQEQIDLKRIKLLDIVGSGRFGTVHKATLSKSETPPVSGGPSANDDADGEPAEISEIAVKIIPDNEIQSWQNELRIFSSPKTRHANILKFLGSTTNPDTNSHWLLVEYASNGSLHHFLKHNTVNWQEFLSISLGIARGLSHLHDADVAHRDFKSKNVLLRDNLSPCITDFGVAAMLDVGSSGSQHEQRKKYLQVGTPRYMAPEVLECSVAFTKISFIKIDVYALSLVLWELLSRLYPLPKVIIRDGDYEDATNYWQPSIGPYVRDADDFEARIGLLDRVKSSSPIPPDPDDEDVADGTAPANLSRISTNGLETSIDLSDIAPPAQYQPNSPPVYKLPFEDVVGANPDINTMRQAVVSKKLRPPIKSEWLYYPLSKLCQAIIDGWEYDHDARISASCFVERIETLRKQLDISSLDLTPDVAPAR